MMRKQKESKMGRGIRTGRGKWEKKKRRKVIQERKKERYKMKKRRRKNEREESLTKGDKLKLDNK